MNLFSIKLPSKRKNTLKWFFLTVWFNLCNIDQFLRLEYILLNPPRLIIEWNSLFSLLFQNRTWNTQLFILLRQNSYVVYFMTVKITVIEESEVKYNHTWVMLIYSITYLSKHTLNRWFNSIIYHNQYSGFAEEKYALVKEFKF